jgi:hypothetical protein
LPNETRVNERTLQSPNLIKYLLTVKVHDAYNHRSECCNVGKHPEDCQAPEDCPVMAVERGCFEKEQPIGDAGADDRSISCGKQAMRGHPLGLDNDPHLWPGILPHTWLMSENHRGAPVTEATHVVDSNAR